MDKSDRDRLRAPAAGIGRLAKALVREMVPKILFFFIAFMILFVLFKLFVAQYAITYAAFTRAAVAALILGKVVPLLDWAQSGYRFETQRRIVVITAKTLVYALVVVALGTAERFFEAYRTARTVHGAITAQEAQANVSHFLGLVLLISLVVGGFLTLQAIDEALGKGTLLRILWGRPQERARDA